MEEDYITKIEVVISLHTIMKDINSFHEQQKEVTKFMMLK